VVHAGSRQRQPSRARRAEMASVPAARGERRAAQRRASYWED